MNADSVPAGDGPADTSSAPDTPETQWAKTKLRQEEAAYGNAIRAHRARVDKLNEEHEAWCEQKELEIAALREGIRSSEKVHGEAEGKKEEVRAVGPFLADVRA